MVGVIGVLTARVLRLAVPGFKHGTVTVTTLLLVKMVLLVLGCQQTRARVTQKHAPARVLRAQVVLFFPDIIYFRFSSLIFHLCLSVCKHYNEQYKQFSIFDYLSL